MNWKGQTVLGWFAAPGSDITSRFETARIASAYFRTIQISMLKVILCNFLGQHTEESEGEEIVQMVVREACALFQDLIGFVVQRLSKIPNTMTSTTIMDTDSTTSQAFFSAPTFNEVLSQFQSLNQETKSDIMEMNIMQGLIDGTQSVNGLGHNGISINNNVKITDNREDEDDDLGELYPLWGNGQELTNKKLRTRRASTTDIADGPSKRNFGNLPEFLDDISKKRKGLDIDNNRNAIKKAKTPVSTITNVIPAPFKVIPGQASEYFQQVHSEDNIHYSSDFDESLMTSYTASFFAPINFGQLSSSPITTFAQHRITSAYDAISHHINSHTREKISRYEKSCHEYELLLEILEALDGVGDEVALSKKLEKWTEDAEEDDEEYEEVLITDNHAASEPRSEEVDIESSDSEPQESISDNDRENENPADTLPKIKVTSIKCHVENENKSEDGEMDDETSLNNNGVVNGEVSSSSSMEEGEIEDEEEPGITWQSQSYRENNKKSDDLPSSLFRNKNIKSASFNLEVGKTINSGDNSPGWAWDDGEIGD
ncbi:hypothetical protein C1645_874297 [Glomus cerebriforme]|uniref:Uncharacterized protein n=1 Tax=Glomus cerebriforme TaxID=658196 RepID=A0A397T4L3_9GLOM|nr:hypothetical protein C1645_874297 [Glomus cerebriforme]